MNLTVFAPRWRSLGLLLLACATLAVSHAAENRDTKVRDDRTQVQATGNWIYNDLDRALAEGRRSGKPILVTLRCIP